MTCESVLDVQKSVLGKKWAFSPADDRLAQGISQAFGLPEIVGRILVARGVRFDDVEGFLNPALKTQLPNPSILKDMDKAAARIADAIINKQKVAVFGDYDVDGATSSALLKKFFKAVGAELRIYIPDRIQEGYGPNAPALLKLKNEGMEVVITVDCGATAFDALEAGTAAGLDIIVLDHHRAEARIPEAYAVVNPNRLDDNSNQGHLAAVGVTFLAIVAVNRLLRERGFYTELRPEPRILQWLDIVALGTVCDVVPLTGINRAFVAQGLRVMAMRQNAGLVALGDVAGLSEAPGTFHAGFVFGPRVNAGGRVGEAGLGARLLSTDDPWEAKALALQLHQYNAERKEIEKQVLEEAIEKVESSLKGDLVLLVDGEGWHPGVIGIVAARLKEKYNRPACVIVFDDKGIGKASGRSISNIDLGSAIISAKQNGILMNGGGHKMAAGFTVARDQLKALAAHINNHVLQQLDGAAYAPELRIDGVLSLHALTLDLTDKLNMLAPYGAGHAEPRFALAGVKIIKPCVVGENHVSCFIQDTSGGASLKGIAFRAMDSALGEMLLQSGAAPLYLAGHVSVNEWNGKKTVDFQIVDAARIWGAAG
ncbi:MAG: single-stranded-DNA-specific exonuclease RecJ [Alphaproteobacteria bacterium]|nr:single-stranded-DNA-specific exonuclease RecJ [Alphaproteobacteria bacterium]